MKYRCAHCSASLSLPLKKHEASCSACGRPILVNPERPFLNIWFLLALVMFALPAIGTLSNKHWNWIELLSAATTLLIPLGIYLTMLYFSGIEPLFRKKQEPGLEPSIATIRPIQHRQEPSLDPAPAAKSQGPAKPSGAATVFGVLLMGVFIGAYIAWVYVYLALLRPRMNEWLAHYINSYPAMLHLIPLIGLPILAVWLVGRIFALGRFVMPGRR